MTDDSIKSEVNDDPRNRNETGPDASPGSAGPVSAIDLDQTALNETFVANDAARQNIDVDSVDADIAEAFARDVGEPTDTSTAHLPTDAADTGEP
jgi:hypothetical protein